MKYKFNTKIKKVEQKSRIARGRKDSDGGAVFENEDLGWYVLVDGHWEWLYLGDEAPALRAGDEVTITLEAYHAG